MTVTRRRLLKLTAALPLAAPALSLLSTSASAAARIQRVVSKGGIEAWLVQDATVPLIAMEYAFAGGSSQDTADKPGTGSFTANTLDEGAADLDSKAFHERLERRAIEMLDKGQPRTPYMAFGDTVRLQARHDDGRDGPFGVIEQRVVRAARVA